MLTFIVINWYQGINWLGVSCVPVPVKLMNRDWNEFKIEQLQGDEFWACLGAFME